MQWTLSHRYDPPAVALADRHYSRQKPGTPQFMPPGACLVLRTACRRAVWGTSWQRFIRHGWSNTWTCSIFRNEGAGLSSGLIVDAIAASRWCWVPPSNGCITFVDEQATAARRSRRSRPGECFRHAGFREVGRTLGGLVVLQLSVADMPPAVPPHGAQMSLLAAE